MTTGGAYLFHMFLTTPKNFNEIRRSFLLKMIICEYCCLKSTKAGIEALISKGKGSCFILNLLLNMLIFARFTTVLIKHIVHLFPY